MKVLHAVSVITVALGLICVVPAVGQDRSLTLTDVHICCPGCANAINKAIEKVDLISAEVNREEKTVTLRGGEGVTRQDAMAGLKALADAGFYGASSHERFRMKDESEGLSGTVTSLSLTGIHNCCGACDKAIKATVASVEGTEVPELGKKARDFTVTGNFDGASLIKAFNKAGLYVKVKKDS